MSHQYTYATLAEAKRMTMNTDCHAQKTTSNAREHGPEKQTCRDMQEVKKLPRSAGCEYHA